MKTIEHWLKTQLEENHLKNIFTKLISNFFILFFKFKTFFYDVIPQKETQKNSRKSKLKKPTSKST